MICLVWRTTDAKARYEGIYQIYVRVNNPRSVAGGHAC